MQATGMQNKISDENLVRDARVVTALAWIGQQLSAGDIDIDKIARAVNLSSSHFRHLFQQHTGITPHRYHKLLRLQKAQNLLRESFLNVKQVMAEAGWTDESHFCRDYKRVYGESPSKVRSSRAKLDATQPIMARNSQIFQ
jgi:transcriptional regulator GlxA family with amidase domain